MLKDRRFLIILLIQITEVLGFSLILPFLPLFAQDLGASPLLIGLILTSFSFFQFFSSPILGKLSDSYGRKPLLILSQISTFISFIILAFSNSIWMIFFSRMIDGLLGSNYSISQAYISDISSKKNRSKAFGLTGVAFGIGFLIGPAIGGFLAKYGFWLPSTLAAIIALITIFLTIIFLPETVKKEKPKKLKIEFFNINMFSSFFRRKKTGKKLTLWLIYIISHVLWTTSFSLYSNRKFSFGPPEVGFVLAYIGINSIITRGIVIPKLIDRFKEEKLISIGIGLVFTGLISTVFFRNYYISAIILTFLAFGVGLLRPLLLGSISKSVSEKEQGAVLGVANSLNSFAQMVSPIIGGIVLTYFHYESLMITAAVIMFFALIMVMPIKKSID